MKKSNVYNLAIFYKNSLESTLVKFSTARAVRDIFKPYIEVAIEIEEDIKKITPKNKEEIEILLSESVEHLNNFPKEKLFNLLEEYTISAGQIEFLDSI